MLHCRRCGSKLPDQARFCAACGLVLRVTPGISTDVNYPVPSHASTREQLELVSHDTISLSETPAPIVWMSTENTTFIKSGSPAISDFDTRRTLSDPSPYISSQVPLSDPQDIFSKPFTDNSHRAS